MAFLKETDSGESKFWLVNKALARGTSLDNQGEQWAVEIARQKQFGTRPICPSKRPVPNVAKLNSRVLPERKAAAKAKKMFKEISWKDQITNNELRNKNASQNKRGRGAKQKKNSANVDSETLNGSNTIGAKRGNKNTKQRKKKAKRKTIKLNRKEKALIKKFRIEPSIVCLPRLEDISTAIKKAVGYGDDTDINIESQGVNKRKKKRPERIVVLGDNDRDPIVVSDEDSDVEIIESYVPMEGSSNSPIVLIDENDDEDADINNDYNNNVDPNDADVEDDDSDDIDNEDDSSNYYSDDFSDNDEEDDDDMPTFSKFQNSPKTYGGIRRNYLIAPPTFQPKQCRVAPPKFLLPPSFRNGSVFNF